MRKRWLFVSLIFLVVASLLLGCGVSTEEYTKVVNDLVKAQHELQSIRDEAASVHDQLKSVETQLKSVETQFEVAQAELEEKVNIESSLEKALAKETELAGEINKLREEIATLQENNSSLTDELKNIMYPRHFQSVNELKEWLRQDDTDTKYADEDWGNLCCILQVKALRDGYLLPVNSRSEKDTVIMANRAYIGGEMYTVWADTDYVEYHDYADFLPSRPLPLE